MKRYPFSIKSDFLLFRMGGAEDICFLPMPGKDYLEKYYERSMGLFINHVAEIPGNEFKYYDILKLLCNEKDFMRVKF